MPKTPEVPKFLGSTEVCDRIGIDRSTLTRWIQTGRIAYAQKIPGRNGVYLFDPVEVERARADYKADQPAT
jgi:predicted site-specific integrase-resolvase